MIRRVNREPAILLAGGRALLMQVAHPLIAVGVAEHSRFEDDRLGRLLRTLRTTYALVFGAPWQARRTADRLNALHARVTGSSQIRPGYPAEGYSALDPALLLWVHATLVDSALLGYERFVQPLSRDEQQRYYEECTQVAVLLEMPPEVAPPDIEAFRVYMRDMVDHLEVSDEARRIASALFSLRPLRGAPTILLARELTAGLLAPRLRRQFGLGWGPRRQALLDASAGVSQAATPLLPRALRRPLWPLVPRGVTVR